MANRRLQNSFYIDTAYAASTDELAIKGIKVTGIFVTTTNTNAIVVLSDGANPKLELRNAVSGVTDFYDLALNPLSFQTSIRPTTLTNAKVTCILANPGTE